MSSIDWYVLIATIAGIAFYGIWKSRHTRTLQTFLLADRQLPWYHIAFSVMATQASAITFLSAPALGFTNGLQFVQFYFGLPLAMIVLCITFVPIFHKLNVYTAYEYLEKRFDLKTRTFTAFLFLLQRGVSNGISIYAPAIVLSSILNIHTNYTIVFIGALVMLYTVYGGTKAVSHTQLLQMTIIFSGLIISAYMIIRMLPEGIDFTDALHIAGKAGKMNAIDTTFDLNNRYNLWSGIIGGFFLQLSYFGTDQSQVGRYLTAKSITQSRLGLVFNGLIKIPMQFFILLIGVLVFSFYQFHESPLFFNQVEINKIENVEFKKELSALQQQHSEISKNKSNISQGLIKAKNTSNDIAYTKASLQIEELEKQTKELRKNTVALMTKYNPSADTNDSNYIFLNFVTQHLPVGIAGLLIAIIFLASMGSLASGLNSLASTTVVDIYKRLVHKDTDRQEYLKASRWSTFAWGVFCILAALFASKLGNLIEAVNILGSLFYGTILGIFVTAFYLKKVQGNAVFFAALVAEIFVIISWWLNLTAFLWLNLIGCVLVMLFSLLFQLLKTK